MACWYLHLEMILVTQSISGEGNTILKRERNLILCISPSQGKVYLGVGTLHNLILIKFLFMLLLWAYESGSIFICFIMLGSTLCWLFLKRLDTHCLSSINTFRAKSCLMSMLAAHIPSLRRCVLYGNVILQFRHFMDSSGDSPRTLN